MGNPSHGSTTRVSKIIAITATPGGEDPAEIEQRIANCGEFRIDDRRQLRPIAPEHDIREMVIAVQDAGPELSRSIGIEVARYLFNAWETVRPRPTFEFGIAGKLTSPAFHLPFEIIIRFAKIVQTYLEIIHAAQRRDAVHQRETHRAPQGGITAMRLGQGDCCVEPVNRFTQRRAPFHPGKP